MCPTQTSTKVRRSIPCLSCLEEEAEEENVLMEIRLEEAEVKANIQERQTTINHPLRQLSRQRCQSIGSNRQGSDFVVNTRFILNHMQSQFVYGEDVASALKNRAELNYKALELRKM